MTCVIAQPCIHVKDQARADEYPAGCPVVRAACPVTR
jgi:hypothetical protein